MSFLRHARTQGAVILAALSLAGCGGGGDGPATGAVTVNLTDSPVDEASAVVVKFTGIELHRTNGESVDLDFGANPKSIDLIQLQDGATSVLTQDAAVPAGTYDWMRLKVLANKDTQDESYITLLSGEQFPLWIPSGAETGLKLVRPFTVGQGSTTKLVIDFDLRKSVTAPPGQDPNYVMRPALRLVDELEVGVVTATVDLAALTALQLAGGAAVSECNGGLYLFAGGASTPDDQDGDATDGADPIVYESIPYDGVNASVPVTIPFIEAGSYTLAATCDLDVDVAGADDYDAAAAQGEPGFETMRWTIVGSVSVTSNNTTEVSVP